MEFFTPNKGDTCITIVLDVTQSMKDTLTAMVGGLAHYVVQRVALGEEEWSEVTRLSLVLFDDHYTHGMKGTLEHELYTRRKIPHRFLTSRYDKHLVTDAIRLAGTTDNLEEYISWLKTAVPLGGNDDPEAVACALFTARQLDPVSRIWLVTDSLPHGVGMNFDNFPSGCPCGVPLDLTNVSIIGKPHEWAAHVERKKEGVVGDIIPLDEVIDHLYHLRPTEVEAPVEV